MLRHAAKNFNDVVVIVEPSDYDLVIAEMNKGDVTPKTRFMLSAKAYAHTAKYDSMISSFFIATGAFETEYPLFHKKELKPAKGKAYPEKVPSMFSRLGEAESKFEMFHDLPLIKVQDMPLRREPAPVAPRSTATPARRRRPACSLQGKELSFNNIARHRTPRLGMREGLRRRPPARDRQARQPVRRGLGANAARGLRQGLQDSIRPRPSAASIAFNRRRQARPRALMMQQFVEVVIAPAYDAEALAVVHAQAEHAPARPCPGGLSAGSARTTSSASAAAC